MRLPSRPLFHSKKRAPLSAQIELSVNRVVEGCLCRSHMIAGGEFAAYCEPVNLDMHMNDEIETKEETKV